jgi:hypothetical protein
LLIRPITQQTYQKYNLASNIIQMLRQYFMNSYSFSLTCRLLTNSMLTMLSTRSEMRTRNLRLLRADW